MNVANDISLSFTILIVFPEIIPVYRAEISHVHRIRPGNQASQVTGLMWKGPKAKFRRRTSHEPNRMLIRGNKGFFSIAFDSAHVKYGVWTWP